MPHGKHPCCRRRRGDPHRSQPGSVARRLRGAARPAMRLRSGAGSARVTAISSSPTSSCRTRTCSICCRGSRKLRPELPVVVMSAQNTFMTAIRASERGAYEYLPKPFDLKELIAHCRARSCRSRKSARRSDAPRRRSSIPFRWSAVRRAMQEIYRVLARLMQTDLTVMITRRVRHRQGTGRTRAARLRQAPRLVPSSPSTWRPSRAISLSRNCSATRRAPSPAPTRAAPAASSRPKAARCSSTKSATCRWKRRPGLLRVLQQGEYTTVGGRTPIKADVRIIAATNKDLRILIQQGLFREDLFFRLNVVPLRLPPLRERTEDVPDLHAPLLRPWPSAKGSRPSRSIRRRLTGSSSYRWPGNVRELENLVAPAGRPLSAGNDHRRGHRR